MLRKLSIEGLRGYANRVELRPSLPNGLRGSGITVIVGPNNSGKSTLVEAFRARRQYNEPSFNVGMRNRKTDSVTIMYEFENHTETIKSIRKGSSETVTSGKNIAAAPVYFVPSRRYFSPAFGRGSPASRDDFMTQYMSNTNDRAPQIGQFEGRLLQIERDQESFNKVARRVLPDLLSWSIDQHETNQYFLKFYSDHKSHSSEGVGEGIVSVFVISAALYDSRPGDILVIDEPELSLHPQVQRRLADLLEDYASDRQIIISTHSPYFITKTAILGGCTICRTWDRRGSIELHQISIQDGANGLKQIIADNINNPHVFGLDAREVFFLEDHVLVFEGQEDVVLWPKVIGNTACDYGVFGWGAGGASNIKYVIEILYGLGFEKIGAIFDNDRQQDFHEVSRLFPDVFVRTIPADDIRTKKAVTARPSKPGILDDRGNIRQEYANDINKITADLNEFMKQ